MINNHALHSTGCVYNISADCLLKMNDVLQICKISYRNHSFYPISDWCCEDTVSEIYPRFVCFFSPGGATKVAGFGDNSCQPGSKGIIKTFTYVYFPLMFINVWTEQSLWQAFWCVKLIGRQDRNQLWHRDEVGKDLRLPGSPFCTWEMKMKKWGKRRTPGSFLSTYWIPMRSKGTNLKDVSNCQDERSHLAPDSIPLLRLK